MRKLLPYAVAVGIVLFAVAMTWVVLRGEDTRDRLRTVYPCQRPKSDACQRQIRLILRELVRRHPDEFRLKAKPRREGSNTSASEQSGGVVPGSPPSGNDPTGRANIPNRDGNPPPPAPPPPSPPPPESRPLIDLRAPAPVQTCVGDVLAVNCR